MPFRELRAVARGGSNFSRWRLIVTQVCFAVSIVGSIAIADRVLTLLLDGDSVSSITPARLINQSVAAHAPQSVFAAPIAASLLLLGGVIASTELLRLWSLFCHRSRVRPPDACLVSPIGEQSPESQLS
jgi:hypothetical protein